MHVIQYEGVSIETCGGCHGQWLDNGELGKIVSVRERYFNPEERRAIAESVTIDGRRIENLIRDLKCPKCGGATTPVNYGGDTGIIIDRCTGCRGIWLDAGELDKIQMVVEGWEDALPDDLRKFGPRLRMVQEKERNDDDSSQHPNKDESLISAAIGGIFNLFG